MTEQQKARVTPDQLEALLTPRIPENPIVITTCLLDNTPGKPASLLGLGDHSVLSTLPKRFHDLGYDVYLDKDVQASNKEILELVWYSNPYIKGLSDKKPNAGYTRQGKIYEIANALQGHRGIEAVERAHGLPPIPRKCNCGYNNNPCECKPPLYSMAPWYAYKPKPHHLDLKNTVLVDYAAVSSAIARDRLADAVRVMQGKFRNAPLMQVLHPPWVAMNGTVQYLPSAYMEQSVFEYIDMIASCRAWVGSEAGAQCLAAFVRGEHDVYEDGIRPEICVTSNRDTFNSRLYVFRGVDYRCTGHDGKGDYFFPGEMRDYQYANQCRIRGVEFEQRRHRVEATEQIA